jgi:hypothetical protein
MKVIRQELGGFGRSNGKIAEDTYFKMLQKDMTYGGILFEDISRNMRKKKTSLNLEREYDIVLINGTMLAIIEVKHLFRKIDVNEFAKNINDFRILYPEFSNHKIITGIGGMGFEDDAISTAKEKGMGIIRIVNKKAEYDTEGLKIY